MQINVSQQLKAPIGSVRDYELSDYVEIAGSASLVSGTARLTRTDRSILVRGTLHTELEVTCSRCLTPYGCPLTLNIEDEYFPTTDVLTGSRLSLPDEVGFCTIDEHHILDLSEAVRQYALLVIPMKPLCHKDCAGLCSRCGHNLNLGACTCPEREVDPRWAALAGLANDEKGTE